MNDRTLANDKVMPSRCS